MERPIIFSGEMVRAILDGRKTQTRRVVFTAQAAREDRTDRGCWDATGYDTMVGGVLRREPWTACSIDVLMRYPYGAPGDTLWVRETWCDTDANPAHDWRISEVLDESGYDFTAYRADDWLECPANDGRWRPAIHMPRRRSRLILRITDVRVERLQDISEADAKAEGVTREYNGPRMYPSGRAARTLETHYDAYARLWDTINGKRAPWESNPWVWAITFEVLS